MLSTLSSLNKIQINRSYLQEFVKSYNFLSHLSGEKNDMLLYMQCNITQTFLDIVVGVPFASYGISNV